MRVLERILLIYVVFGINKKEIFCKVYWRFVIRIKIVYNLVREVINSLRLK